MSRCPELRTCKLVVTVHIHDEAPLAVELKFLETLELKCTVMNFAFMSLLGRLSLPELRNFTLRGQKEAGYTPSLARIFALWTRLESVDIDNNIFTKS
jgi:hypothetical protein